MPSRPTIEPLPRTHRRLVFWSFLLIFLVTMPALWFYTTGYRFAMNGTERSIVSVGGLYITTDSQDVDFFVDDVQVTNFRIFRQAAYIPDLIEGKHAVHVQGEGLQTWTKDLPVRSYIVTEALAFTMPTIPRIRVIGEYTTATGTSVIRVQSTSTLPFAFASTTAPYTATTSRATTTLIANQEYDFVAGLFATTSATSSIVTRITERVERGLLPFASSTVATTTTTTTKEWRNVRLFEDRDGEVQVSWLGSDRERPHYFCIEKVSASTTPTLYGEHVFRDMLDETLDRTIATTDDAAITIIEGTRVCRDTIRIDRKGKEVRWFDFYPESTDLILMLLDDGLYVVEVDDRAWQNTQLLYPGTSLEVALDGGRIYVKDRGYLLEVFTTLPEVR